MEGAARRPRARRGFVIVPRLLRAAELEVRCQLPVEQDATELPVSVLQVCPVTVAGCAVQFCRELEVEPT